MQFKMQYKNNLLTLTIKINYLFFLIPKLIINIIITIILFE